MSSSPLASIPSMVDRPDRLRSMALDDAGVGVRELMAIREIVHAFLSAERPAELYQFALDRVTPIVGAAFACVYVTEAGSELMRLEAVHNWPQRYAQFLKDMRVRLGSGPSGEAASQRRVIEIPDLFADPSLVDWQEVATELGFRSLVALPLQTARGVTGAVTFYFSASGGITSDARDLLQVVADQMAASAEKARLIDDLSVTNDALQESHAQLEKQYIAVLDARRLQDEFLSNVSHELRTPLTAVMGYLSLMEEGLAGPVTAEQQETLSQVKGASEQLLELIGDLLELTSLKRSTLTIQAAEFDAGDALRDALRMTGSKRKDGVALEVEQTLGVRLTSDRHKVTRCLTALLSNAFKFTAQGKVHVSVEARDDRVVYRIADTGVGISEDARRFVFDEFRQEDGSATRRYGGSGLGLSIARRLARLLGGDIALSSQQGQGSTFIAELPIKNPLDA